ncbi:unnamed protein product, partial [Meganyctiphanes norvegica]
MAPVTDNHKKSLHDLLYMTCSQKKLAKTMIGSNIVQYQKCYYFEILPLGFLAAIFYVILIFFKSSSQEQSYKPHLEVGAVLAITGLDGAVLENNVLHGTVLATSEPDGVSIPTNGLEGAILATNGQDGTVLPTNGLDLWIAAQEGDLTNVKKILAMGTDPDWPNPNESQSTALQVAAHFSHPEIVKELIAAGANKNIRNDRGQTPIIVASDETHLSIVNILLDANVDVTLSDIEGWTALHNAAWKNRSDIAQLLLHAGADTKKLNKNDRTPGDPATTTSTPTDKPILITEPSKTHSKSESNMPLIIASTICGVIVFIAIVQNVPSVNIYDVSGETPLQIAIRSRSQNVIDILLEVGACTNMINNFSISILHDALFPWDYFNTNDIFKNLNSKTLMNEFTFFANETSSFSQNLVDQLVIRGADVNCIGEGGVTPLMLAAAIGNEHILRTLLKSGSLTDSIDNDGRTALAYACKWGCTKAVQMLLTYGCQPNIQDHKGNLPVFYAAYHAHMDVMYLLMVELAFFYKGTNH